MSKRSTILIAALTFVAGAFVGTVATGTLIRTQIVRRMRTPELRLEFLVARLSDRLDLTESQRRRGRMVIEALIAEIDEERDAFERAIAPAVERAIGEFERDLSEEQAVQLRAFLGDLFPTVAGGAGAP